MLVQKTALQLCRAVLLIHIIYAMKYLFVLFFSALLLSSCSDKGKNTPDENLPTQNVLAFPQAEGAGAFVTGGRNGSVYFVTSLEDDLYGKIPGTLRYALSQNVARTVIFKISGVIQLKAELRIKAGNLTVAGQTAPSDGICIAGYPVIVEADNVIIRFIRFRMGDINKVEGDALTCVKRKNIMIDHCSMSWGTDECASCYGNENFTMQYCLIAQSLTNSVHVKGSHGYGGIWGGKNATFHHNLLAHHDSRNPRFDHDYVSTVRGPVDFVNNVIYNWGGNSAYGGESVASADERRTINMINNYYKYGPDSKHKDRILNPTVECSNCNAADPSAVVPGHFYISGNYVYGSDKVTADNWDGGIQGVSETMYELLKASTPFGMTFEIQKESAEEAYETVLKYAGASLVRDQIDNMVVEDVKNGTGTLIDSQDEVGGWPEYASVEPLADSDMDGIPDEWEDKMGLNKLSYADAKEKTLEPPYTNLEVYLNSLVENLYK